MTEDTRFQPTVRGGKGCDSCKHSLFKHQGVRCLHPLRPVGQQDVVRWFNGCRQHEDKTK